MTARLSRHASIRAQQRGIPRSVLNNIYRFGEVRNASGAISYLLTKEALDDASAELSKQEVQQLSRFRDVYLVVGDQQKVITAARAHDLDFRIN